MKTLKDFRFVTDLIYAMARDCPNLISLDFNVLNGNVLVIRTDIHTSNGIKSQVEATTWLEASTMPDPGLLAWRIFSSLERAGRPRP